MKYLLLLSLVGCAGFETVGKIGKTIVKEEARTTAREEADNKINPIKIQLIGITNLLESISTSVNYLNEDKEALKRDWHKATKVLTNDFNKLNRDSIQTKREVIKLRKALNGLKHLLKSRGII